MSTHKAIDRICIFAVVLCMVLSLVLMNGEAIGIKSVSRTMGYETTLFDTSLVHTIDIEMEDWETFLSTAESEEYSSCNVTIDGEQYNNVGIRGKGNTSLSTVSTMDSDRYSFKIEFDQYDSSISYHGLDKLSLNNIIQDTTYMKDYLTYRMMAEFGVDVPLCSFVFITVNGEDWGLYLAVEGVEDSFLQRNYGSDYGELYKPDSMSFGGGRGNGQDFDMSEFAGEENWNQADGMMPGFNRGQAAENTEEASSAMEESADAVESAQQPAQAPEMTGEITMPEGFDPTAMGEGSGEMAMPEGFDPTAMGEGNGEMTMPQGTDPAAMGSGGMTAPEATETVPEESGNIGDEGDVQTEASEESEETEPIGKEGNQMPQGDFSRENIENMGNMGGMSGMGSEDVKLQYIDDDPDSYSNIFSNAKTDITEEDQQRLIEALQALGEQRDLESTVNIDEVIRYFVVHNFVCNGDSYTGSMIHNYYLYEEDGQLSMIPWDYNLAFGTFQSSDATDTVNSPIDSPVSGGTTEDRPMVDWIFSSEDYTELYHQYFAEFLEEVDIQGIIDEAYGLIAEYVERDPTKFYSYEEFETGVETLKAFCTLRSQSVAAQLAGTIPSTSDGQSEDSTNFVDASAINISDMGTMNMGGSGGMGGNMAAMPGMGGETAVDAPEETRADTASEGTQWQTQGQEMQMPETITRPEGMNFENMEAIPEGMDVSSMDVSELELPEGMDASMIEFPGGTETQGSSTVQQSEIILLALCGGILLLGILIAAKYRHH